MGLAAAPPWTDRPPPRDAQAQPGARPPSPGRPTRVPSLAQMALRTFEKGVDLESALENWELWRDSSHRFAPTVTATCFGHIMAHLPAVRARPGWERLRDELVAHAGAQVKEGGQGALNAHAAWQGREDVLLHFIEEMGIERVAQELPLPTLQEAAAANLPQIVRWYLEQPVWAKGSSSPLLRDVRFDRDAVVEKLLRKQPPAPVLKVLLSFMKPEAIAAWVNRTGPWAERHPVWRANRTAEHLTRYAGAGDLDLLKTLLSQATEAHLREWTSFDTALF
ncbi:MAG TPA: hypothetical protein VFH51_08565, partial [Myxococcota bacterium]|nr:hypothetical protein [Myxococcota bacterium]